MAKRCGVQEWHMSLMAMASREAASKDGLRSSGRQPKVRSINPVDEALGGAAARARTGLIIPRDVDPISWVVGYLKAAC